MNTTENNKLLAEFMGWYKPTFSGNGHFSGNYVFLPEFVINYKPYFNNEFILHQTFLKDDELKFHSDWNWLMQVVEKCFKTEGDYSLHKEIEDALIFNTDNRIEAVYNACVEFVEWYNNQIS